DVVHHRVRVFEHLRVELLVHVAHVHAALVVGGNVGFVDVPNLARLGVEQVAVDLELPRDFENLCFLVVVHKVGVIKHTRGQNSSKSPARTAAGKPLVQFAPAGTTCASFFVSNDFSVSQTL